MLAAIYALLINNSMQFDEIHFTKMVNKQFFDETTAEEDKEIDFWLRRSERAKEIYSIVYKYYFDPDIIKRVTDRPKADEINSLIAAAHKHTHRRRKLRIILFIGFLVAVTVTVAILLRTNL